MNDLIELVSTGNNPLFLAAAVLAGWYFLFNKKGAASGSGIAGWLAGNKLTLLSVATTLFQHKEQLIGFAVTFLSNVKSLFVKPDDTAKK